MKEYEIDEMKDYIIHYDVIGRICKEKTYKICSSSPENARLRFLDMFRVDGVTSASIKDIYEVGS